MALQHLQAQLVVAGEQLIEAGDWDGGAQLLAAAGMGECGDQLLAPVVLAGGEGLGKHQAGLQQRRSDRLQHRAEVGELAVLGLTPLEDRANKAVELQQGGVNRACGVLRDGRRCGRAGGNRQQGVHHPGAGQQPEP